MKNPLTTVIPQKLRHRMPSAFRSLTDIENEMENWLRQNSFDWPNDIEGFGMTPICNVKENAKEYILQFDVPGVKKEDVKIEIENNYIRVSGERKENKEEQDAKHYLSESYYGSFMRSFHIPNSVDQEKVDAHYEDGVLTITVPKLSTSKAKEVKIH